MNERRKILELVQEGKLTLEQAELLIDALENQTDTKSSRFRIPPIDKPKWDKTAKDLKAFGTQVSGLVAQALVDAKKEIEAQVTEWMSHETVSESCDFDLPQDASCIYVDTFHGHIRATKWDKPFGRISVHAEIRTSNPVDAEKILQQAVVVHTTDNEYRLTISSASSVREIRNTSIDVFIPNGIETLELRSKNGNLQADSMTVSELDLETLNGHITTSYVNAGLIRITSSNGRIDLFHTIGLETKNVYLGTKNGTITINGMDSNINCTGTANTSAGQIEIDETYFEVTYIDHKMKKKASFKNKQTTENSCTTHIQCETSNGKIVVQPA